MPRCLPCISSKAACVGLVVFFLGAISLGALNSFFGYTNRMEFCISCHSMSINYEEYKQSLHFKNAVGVQATCADCHVPKEFFPKLQAKIMAAKDVYHEILGTIDSQEKFDARRWHMASNVWRKMKASDSRECRNCHDYDNMDLSEQERIARKKHARAPLKGKTCIDCHRGLVHEEPLEPEPAESADREA